MLKLTSIILLSFVIGQGAAWAKQLHCSGNHKGQTIGMVGSSPGIRLSNAVGTLTVDGTDMAYFDGKGMNWNVLSKSFKFQNSHGDFIVGAFDNFMAGLVTVSKMEVRGKFTHTNVKLKCRTN